ncbi:putative ABC transporter ATP-binding protein [Candidatus Gugararchaeum adminiculabundum]|nr:putative ABC transporter ATP-binding protein [Candidatus Gugararchaeum adminiculabundum]
MKTGGEMAGKIISLKGVTKTYKADGVSFDAVRGVDLDIIEGERISIMGPSGSGKSTLMHMVGLLDVPTKGHIYINGEDVSKKSENELAYIRGKTIGFVFQSFYLVPSLNALENVALPMMFYRIEKEEREKRAKEILKEFGIGEKLANYPNQLSGGQRQRVAIARSLANDPKIILADEPTGNLDSKSGEEVLKVFDDLHQREGRTLVTVTHERYVAERAERIVHIRDGLIEKIEKVDENKRETVRGRGLVK